jgi:hypothetical protein
VPAIGVPATDLQTLLSEYAGTFEGLTIVMSSQNAIGCRLSGHDLFRELRRDGGSLAGIPVVASDAAGDNVLAIDTRRLLVADDGEVAVSLSRQAAITMDSDGASSPTTETLLLFQSHHVAIKVERVITWQAQPGAVAFMTTNWLQTGSPGA